MQQELPIIQKVYDLIKWYVPILNNLPRDHKFGLGNRMVTGLYELLEGLIEARYATEKLAQLRGLNTKLDILRYQTRLLLDFELLPVRRYGYVAALVDDIGRELGGWTKQQAQRSQEAGQSQTDNQPIQPALWTEQSQPSQQQQS